MGDRLEKWRWKQFQKWRKERLNKWRLLEVNELLNYYREHIEAWAAVLTEEEVAAVNQQIIRDYECVGVMPLTSAEKQAALSESLPFKLASIVNDYVGLIELKEHRDIEFFSKTLTVAEVIAEIKRMEDMPLDVAEREVCK